MIKINDTALPSPSGLTVTVKSVTGAGGRNTLGETVRDTLAVKRAVTLVWKRINQSTLASMLALINGNGPLQLTYHDPALGETTIACVAAARAMTMERYDGGATVWGDVTITLEEK